MDQIAPTTFWSVTTIVASAIGAVFFLSVSHSGEPRHSDAASENEVNQIEVKLERVATDVEYNKILLGDLKTEIRELRTEQNESSREILEAIRNGNQ